MKKAILLISVITLILAGCKKDDIAEASKVRIETETIEKGWDYIKINVEYDYPVALEAVTLYLSEKEDMSDANVYECNVEGKKYSVELDSLKAGVAYYYCYEYDNGYEKEKGGKKSMQTISKPVVVTKDVTSITTKTATLNGSVTNSDDANKITEKGFCWGIGKEPTIEGNHISKGSGTGTYSHSLTNLTNNTTYYVRAYVKTNFGIVYGEEKSFTTVEIVLPTVTTNAVTNIKATTATCGGNVTSDGNSMVTSRGVCWSTNQNPTINDNKTTEGSGIGSYSSNLSNLSDNTTYYIRAYATNEKGTSYGEEMSFTTLELLLPTVTTEVTNIKVTTATCGGNVTSDGNSMVTSRGVCWSTSQNPTINDNKTTDGSGIGNFTSSLSNLASQTTYYVRAYATNEKGTAYGEEKSFTTLELLLPTVMTENITNIQTNSARSGGNVSSDGNGTVTARGVCWSTSPTPTIDDNKTTDGSGTGSYTSNISNLSENTTYYVRAYATNEKGTAYGEEKSFRTRALTGTENGYGWVDLGLSVKWATCNVGASTSTDYGHYFAWGETTTKTEYTEDNSLTYGLSYSELQSQGYIDGNGNLTPQYDAATANWGGNWRMPTDDEMQELIDNCTLTWTTQNGVKGYKVRSKVNSNYIFLPAASSRAGSSLTNAGSTGEYWSSTPDESDYNLAYFLFYFGSDYHYLNHHGHRYFGKSVRPVVE